MNIKRFSSSARDVRIETHKRQKTVFQDWERGGGSEREGVREREWEIGKGLNWSEKEESEMEITTTSSILLYDHLEGKIGNISQVKKYFIFLS